MKRLLLLLIIELLSLAATAQKLTVEGMQATNDLSASQYKRNDINEQPCALIKVQLATTGATFEGNVIPPVNYKAGEYWVYMPGGNKELMIKHPSFLPLHINFADYGIKSVQSLVTYRLTLLIPQTSEVVQTQKLTISYTPANAMVLVDSKPYKGNGRVEVTLPVGSHNYIIAAEGYATAEGTVKLNSDAPRTVTEALVATMQTTPTPTIPSAVTFSKPDMDTSSQEIPIKDNIISPSASTENSQTSSSTISESMKSTTGYRVQVFKGGNSRSERLQAEKIGKEIKSYYPYLPVYVHFYSPQWICRVGNYQTYEEAHQMLLSLRKLGYTEAIIVKGKITVPKQ